MADLIPQGVRTFGLVDQSNSTDSLIEATPEFLL
jgi:hypothetical protein